MRIWQHEKKDPTKPTVCKFYSDGMWWAQVRDAGGNFYCAPFFKYEDALEKAWEYAAMNKEVGK